MTAIQPGEEHIVTKLRQAIERLQDDIARLEVWVGALRGFTQPVPDYGHGQTCFDLPADRDAEPDSVR